MSEEQWTDFVAGEISHAFPKGSAWTMRSDSGESAVVKEPRKDVTIIVPQDAG
ncbi:MAG: hypothetical protein ACXWKB_08000 [Methyloceanibacter sp.]